MGGAGTNSFLSLAGLQSCFPSLYFAGGRLMALYPLGPVFDGMGLNLTVLSYMDQVGFGLLACRELVPDLWDLAEGMGVALDELTTRAKGQPKARAARTSKRARPPARPSPKPRRVPSARTRSAPRSRNG